MWAFALPWKQWYVPCSTSEDWLTSRTVHTRIEPHNPREVKHAYTISAQSIALSRVVCSSDGRLQLPFALYARLCVTVPLSVYVPVPGVRGAALCTGVAVHPLCGSGRTGERPSECAVFAPAAVVFAVGAVVACVWRARHTVGRSFAAKKRGLVRVRRVAPSLIFGQVSRSHRHRAFHVPLDSSLVALVCTPRSLQVARLHLVLCRGDLSRECARRFFPSASSRVPPVRHRLPYTPRRRLGWCDVVFDCCCSLALLPPPNEPSSLTRASPSVQSPWLDFSPFHLARRYLL